MDTVIYSILTIAYLFLLILTLRFFKHHKWIRLEIVLLVVILALLYDNGILAFGRYIGEGSLLKALNEARYWFHALFTPLLVLFAWNTLVLANVQWARKRFVKWLVVALTIGLILVEIGTVVWDISLDPTHESGVLSYKNSGDKNAVMIIGVSTMLIISSLIVWWKQKWPWYFFGILSMGIIPVLNLFLNSKAIHNFSEFLLMISLVATMGFQDKLRHRVKSFLYSDKEL